MAFNFIKQKPKESLGIEICSQGLFASLITVEKNDLILKKHAFEPFDGQIIQNNSITNPEGFYKVLQKMIVKNNLLSKNVNVSLFSSCVFIKTVSLPNMPDNEIRTVIIQDASKYLPFPIEEANVDFEILEATNSRDIDVVIAALPKNMASIITTAFNKLGLKINSIDISPFSVLKAYANSDIIDDSDQVDMSVLIKQETTDINIISKGMPVFSNSINVGKGHMVDAIVAGLGIDSEEAAKSLSETVLTIPGVNMTSDNQAASKASSLVRNVFNNIASEVQKTIEFYASRNNSFSGVRRIILSGSGVCIPNVDQYLNNRLKVEVVICNPLKNIMHNISKSENVNLVALTPSIGVSLKGLEH